MEREVAEQEWSGQWVKSASHSLLQANIVIDIVHFLKCHLKDHYRVSNFIESSFEFELLDSILNETFLE